MAEVTARFLVRARYAVFAIMALLTLLCGFLAPRVGVITDMAEFLPEDSQMRAGIALMDEEFPDSGDVSQTRVMFSGLSDSDESRILTELEAIPFVDEVAYEADSPHFHEGEHTLYILRSTHPYGSTQDEAILSALDERFAEEAPVVRSDNPSPASELPAWIVAVAIALLALILVIMSASWVEPLLFLATIGMAVILNLGTNIWRGSIADITFTIGAILQLVLSMDYSIILMNRYRHERSVSPTTTEAMTRALRGSFASIVASSMTTVVGLLMLCFMSLGIGLDLGIALAKGVFLSMIAVFTILPTLILLFDRAIAATAKPYLKPRLEGLARFEYRFRWPILLVFIALFAGSAVTAAGTPVAYTLSKDDPIAEVFPKENTIVLLYANTDEDAAAGLAASLEDEDEVRSVSSHPTTIGRARDLDDMAEALAAMNEDGGLDLDAAMLRLVYFVAHDGKPTETMTVADFVGLIRSDPLLAGRLDPEMTASLDALEPYLDSARLTSPLDAPGLAALLQMSEEEARQILLFHAMTDPSIGAEAMTLPEFTDFVLSDLAADPDYSSLLSVEARSQVAALSRFTDTGAMTTPTSADALASLLGIEAARMRLLYARLAAEAGAYDSSRATLSDYISALNSLLAASPEASGAVTAEQRSGLAALARICDPALLSTPMNAADLAEVLGMPTEQVSALLLLRAQMGLDPAVPPAATDAEAPSSDSASASGAQSVGAQPVAPIDPTTLSASPAEFLDFLRTSVLADPTSPTAQAIPAEDRARIATLGTIIDLVASGARLTPAEAEPILGVDDSALALALAVADTRALRLHTPQEIVAHLAQSTGGAQGAELARLRRIIEDSIAQTPYTPSALASLTGMSEEQARSLALLRTDMRGDSAAWNMSGQDALAFLVDTMLSDPRSSTRFTGEQAAELRRLRALVDSVVEARRYTPAELAAFFSALGEQVRVPELELAFLYDAAAKTAGEEGRLSIAELVRVLDTRIVDDARFAPFIDDPARAAIADARERIDDALIQLVGPTVSRMIITTTLPEESDATEAFIAGLESACGEDFSSGCHLIGDSVLIHEMSRSFDTEMSLISWLTAGSIFLVVALTFLSLSVPLLLVLLVQCGVFLTITTIGLQGYSNYYLAQLMVQCILMGATIDYGILLTSQYREARRSLPVREALGRALRRSIHTIATSGSIMILVTGVLAELFENPTVGQICRTISMGALAATILIVLVLPALLAALDRFLAGKDRLQAAPEPGRPAPAGPSTTRIADR